MKRLFCLSLAAGLAACAPAPQAQPVMTYEGEVRVLLLPQRVRVSYTVNPLTHEVKGAYRNLSSGDTFVLEGTLLPGPEGDTLTARITPAETARLNASVLGFGISNIPLKAGATLSAVQVRNLLTGTLTVNAVRYPLTLKWVP
ncbi:hypothetical protein [Deinococcus multiflagellatus]|uniref:Lipoprotein n=1 Tax=Deinococcus multiflagellatus TaxID=1656887 RepID=A0ABW1ZGN8_9DEIO|nr:hypothetical protein [Deinococcus multiflagellatus]MBZ9712113.1 hypothetical protein [Deinococcus multiflagellatus]